MADRLAGGNLAEQILEQRAAGASLNEVCRTLYADHRIEVSVSTLHAWLKLLEQPEPAEASA